MFFYIKISAKEKRVISNFMKFFSRISSDLKLLQLSQFPNKRRRKFVTVLKSPHVNKTAQEQFEFRIYSKQFLVFSAKPSLFCFVIKKLNSSTFSGIKLELNSVIEKRKKDKKLLSILNPDNLCLRRNQNFSLIHYTNLFDSFGEAKIKNSSIFSSVG